MAFIYVPLMSLALAVPLAVGLFLVYRGVRGVPLLSAPKCARCAYDLRWIDHNANVRCPECGSDLKSREAVRFGEYQRRPWLILCGCGVILASAMAPYLIGLYVAYSRSPRRLSTNSIIAKLPTTAGQPWDWLELERRSRSGQLSKQDAAAAIEQLIAHLKTRPNGWNEPLHWSGQFVSGADSAGVITDEQFGRLACAYYGSQPTVNARSRVREGQSVAFEVVYGHVWDLSGLKPVKALRRLTLDGVTELKIYQPHRTQDEAEPDQLSAGAWEPIRGQVVLDAPPGKHNLIFEVDMGLVPQSSSFRTMNGLPGQAKRWPKPRCTWSKTVLVPVEVLGRDRPAVDLVTDEALNPAKNSGISVVAIAYPRSPTESVLNLSFDTKALPIPVAFSVRMKIDGRDVLFDGFEMDRGRGNWKTGRTVPRPSAAVQTIDVVLTPSVERAERVSRFDAIWGKEIVFRDLPLQREDLEPDEPTANSRPTSRPMKNN